MTEQDIHNNKRLRTFWLAVLAGVLLVIANVGVWLNWHIFDTQSFANTATAALATDSSRQAIAQNVTDRVFANRPVLKNIAGDVSVKIVSGLLATSQAENAIHAVATRLQTAVTTSHRQSITIDLSGVTSILNELYNVSADLGRQPKINPNEIPSQIVLVNKDQIPNFYVMSVVALWAAPLAFIGTVIALAYPYFKNTWDYKATLMIQGACVAAIMALALLLGPLFKPVLLGNVPTQSGQQVIGNVFNAFVSELNHQTAWLIVLGLLALIVGAVLQAIPRIQQKRAQSKNAKST